MPDALPLVSVNHVGLLTLRLEESTAFYRDLLGFREVARPKFDFPGSWLYGHGIMIHLIYNKDAGGPEGEIRTRVNHLALHSDDLERVEQLLGEHGVAYRKNQVVGTGIQQIFFRDPDGHHVEVGHYPPLPVDA